MSWVADPRDPDSGNILYVARLLSYPSRWHTFADAASFAALLRGRAIAAKPVMLAKKILCAIDFSRDSNMAMAIAAEMAAASGAALTLAHVWQPPILARDSAALLADKVHAAFVADATEALATAKARVEGLGAPKVETKLLAGVAWDCLVKEAASDPAYDLIVMGTHGRTGIEHVLVGSVAEKVLRHAPCPVLVARRRVEAHEARAR